MAAAPIRIFDTFLFDGELGLLQHRLTQLYNLIDGFVIVEAKRTYRNHPKPWVFAEHREKFAWATDKIRWIGLDNLGGPSLSPRERAEIQRNSVLLALRDLVPEDVVLLLDADEIPSRGLLERLRTHGLAERSRLAMTRHYEFLNVVAPASPCCVSKDAPFPMELGVVRPGEWEHLNSRWYGYSGVAVHFSDLSPGGQQPAPAYSPYMLRFSSYITAVLPEAGRHFTSVDPAARLESKLGRVFHEEHATERGKSVQHLLRCRRYGIHHRGWWYAEMPEGELPADLQRLAENCPEMMRSERLPPQLLRRAIRTWAWLRLWKCWPEKVVLWVDRHLPSLLPLLLLPLLLGDGLRALLALRLWRRPPARTFATGWHGGEGPEKHKVNAVPASRSATL